MSDTPDDDPFASLDPADRAFLADLLADEAAWLEPSDDLEASILREALADPSGDADVVLTAEHQAAILSIDHLARRRRPRAWLVTAAAAIAVAATIVLATHRTSSAPSFRVALAATDAAPGASASARLIDTTSGVEIDLDASGLPTLPAGSFYQAWVKGDAGLVTVGTFHSSGKVVLWAGVPLDRYPTLTVTIEQEDNNPASSGKVVLKAALPPHGFGLRRP